MGRVVVQHVVQTTLIRVEYRTHKQPFKKRPHNAQTNSRDSLARMRYSWLNVCYLLWIVSPTFGENNSALIELLRTIKTENNFRSLLLMKHHNASILTKFNPEQEGCELGRSIMEELQVPLMQLNEQVSFSIFEKQSNLIMSVVYLNGTQLENNMVLLQRLVANLHLMTTTRVVFLEQSSEANQLFLFDLFVYCWKNNLLNVLVLFGNFEVS